MANTTIQIDQETKKLIGTFGSKEDSYNDIVLRLYDFAVKEQLRQLLMSDKSTMSIDEAIKKSKKRWKK
ncbi:hypothetical protein HOC01_00570 [archaeon]|nr:hypothetical protein [archaeon]MBT6698666.1 hypothetical protein [archaeon]